MKKNKVLNAALSESIARMGHTDSLTVCDAGLPIPRTQHCIDLALTAGVPSFLESLAVVLSELFVERMVLAEEIKIHNPEVLRGIEALRQRCEAEQGRSIALSFISHEDFKKESQRSKSVLRTGECTPYANILLYSGVPF